MATTIGVQDETKDRLDAILDAENHTSMDSAVKSLLMYRELYLQDNDELPITTSPPQTAIEPPNYEHTSYYAKPGSELREALLRAHIHAQLKQPTERDVVVLDFDGTYTSFCCGVDFELVDHTSISADPYRVDVQDDGSVTWANWGRSLMPHLINILLKDWDENDVVAELSGIERGIIDKMNEDSHKVPIASSEMLEIIESVNEDIAQYLWDMYPDGEMDSHNELFDDSANLQVVSFDDADEPLVAYILTLVEVALQADANVNPVEVYVTGVDDMLELDGSVDFLSQLLISTRADEVAINYLTSDVEGFYSADSSGEVYLFPLKRYNQDFSSSIRDREISHLENNVKYDTPREMNALVYDITHDEKWEKEHYIIPEEIVTHMRL